MTIAVSGHLDAEITKDPVAMDTGETMVGLARTPGNVQNLSTFVRPGDYDDAEQL